MENLQTTDSNKKTILILCDWFEPGFKAGGPIRSCVNFARNMKGQYNIYVLTSDRDINESKPYENVSINNWFSFEPGIEIMYLSPDQLTWKRILRELRIISPDFLYLNSMYSKVFSLYPLLMKRFGSINSTIILAPRGMLGTAALHIKSGKKTIFLSLFRMLGLHRIIHFHATDSREFADVGTAFGAYVKRTQVSNFPSLSIDKIFPLEKKQGSLKLVYISRLHPIKNLDFLLTVLAHVRGDITLEIIGTHEDKIYFDHCCRLINNLPKNICIILKGEIVFSAIPDFLNKNHVFVLPSKGENFGHVIFEALSHGRPAIISDQTPWTDLEKVNAGFALPLNNSHAFVNALQVYVNMDQQEYDKSSRAAWNYSNRYRETEMTLEKYIALFGYSA